MEELARQTTVFRDRLLPMATIAPTRDDDHAREARASARAASESFWACVARLPSTRRGARRLAERWEGAAAMAYWHRREVFRDAEELGFSLIAHLIHRGCSRGQWLEFTDACDHATAVLDRQMRSSGEHQAVLRAAQRFTAHRAEGEDVALRAAADAFADARPPQPGDADTRKSLHQRGPFADQTELRWRMGCDATSLGFQNALAGDASSREADRRYLPWLEQTLDALHDPMTTTELDAIAAQWRTRRAEFLDNPTWADVIIVEALPRKPTTRWWRLWHGNEPPLPG
jgi:hypothetical protein